MCVCLSVFLAKSRHLFAVCCVPFVKARESKRIAAVPAVPKNRKWASISTIAFDTLRLELQIFQL